MGNCSCSLELRLLMQTLVMTAARGIEMMKKPSYESFAGRELPGGKGSEAADQAQRVIHQGSVAAVSADADYGLEVVAVNVVIVDDIAAAPEESTVIVSLGSPENSIKVGDLTKSDFEVIMSICPVLNV
ncbi:hypothetical protein KC19_8G071600 [Ceratodon purpureus]|uniref:Uncharacterized protein n=1 Tax=Ceratodon purpureus TaxID=3225 RepID=A0A8T0H4C0_CERPU|nr:hypothetical protein KC19_8G071600 [Ceratodon purpureus]